MLLESELNGPFNVAIFRPAGAGGITLLRSLGSTA